MNAAAWVLTYLVICFALAVLIGRCMEYGMGNSATQRPRSNAMNNEEIVEKIRAANREALPRDAFGDIPDEWVLQLLDQASIRGFQLGAQFALADVVARMVVREAGQ